MFQAGNNIFQAEGLKAFWKGNTAGILLYASYNACQFTVFNWLKTDFNVKDSFAGGGAALVSTVVTYPLDTLRTRMSVGKHSWPLLKSLRYISMNEGFF